MASDATASVSSHPAADAAAAGLLLRARPLGNIDRLLHGRRQATAVCAEFSCLQHFTCVVGKYFILLKIIRAARVEQNRIDDIYVRS